MWYLLGSAADEGLGVQYGVQLPQDGGEVGVSLDSGQQVVISTLLFDHGRRLLGKHTDLLVAVLKDETLVISTTEVRLQTLLYQKKNSNTTCLLPPAFTTAMMMFSVAMKGSSWRMCLSMTLG